MPRSTYLNVAALFTGFCVLLGTLSGPLRAAPDNTLGMALMSATVSGSFPPTIVRGSGALSVNRPGSGYVDVVFDRDLSNCTCTASTGGYLTGPGIAGAAFASANCPNAAANSVRVVNRNADGTLVDVSFHLIVFCPK